MAKVDPVLKRAFFVRHGESEANAEHDVFQGETSRLTEKGKEQARFIAERCAKLDAQALIASTAVRAQGTAGIISARIGLSVETEGLFTERHFPQELIGKRRDDPEAAKRYAQWLTASFSEEGHIGSGENLRDIRERAAAALEYLEKRPEERLLVVSHGFFLHVLAATVLLGADASRDDFDKLIHRLWVDNTGLIVLEYRDQVLQRLDGKHFRGWIVRVWNDHAHLG